VQAWHQRLRQPGSLRREVGNGLEHINGGPPVKQDGGQQQAQPYLSPNLGATSTPPPPGAQQAGYPTYPGPAPYGPGIQQGNWAGGGGMAGPNATTVQPYPTAPPGAQVNYQQAPPPPPPGQAPAGPPPAAVAQGWSAEQWAAAPPHVKAAYGA
jgi:hypothetical protein